jgi:two-component system, NtrC family, sensor kinase
MADVASEVLHNVGNILNSINVTTTQMSEIVAASKADALARVAAMLDERREDLGVFLSEDAKGKPIPVFLSEVSGLLQSERSRLAEMLKGLTKNVQHIKDTITTQQSYAKVSGMEEPASIEEVIEDALQINRAGLERHGARLVMELEPLPSVQVNKQKVVQILVNLINNGKYALSYRKGADKVMCIRLYRHEEASFCIEVIDNGIGIAQENLTRIFRHGFTTKKNGHGFGLHSGALAAKEMGGSLRVDSDGPGLGATFTLELPFKAVAGRSVESATTTEEDVTPGRSESNE